MLIGYSIPLALLFSLAGLIGLASVKVFDSLTKIDRAEEAIIQTDRMSISLLLMVRDFRGYFIFNNQDFLKKFDTNWQTFQAAYKQANQTVENAEQQQRLNQMLDLGNQWKNDYAQVVINLTKVGKRQEGLGIVLTGKGTALVDKFDKLNQKFNQVALLNLKAANLEARNTLSFLVFLGVGLALLSAIVAGIVVYWISLKVARKITQETEKISSSAIEIAATAEQQENASAKQAIAVNQTTTTMDELGISSQQSAKQAEAALTCAHQALVLAKGGTKAVEQTLEGMDILREKVNALAQQILDLSEQTNQIGNISSLVSELAKQTNMLALNAAVEAVRAGENGKGFAVVATEIRKLADESKTSASKINILVADTQKAINSTALVTDESTKTVETGVKIAQATAEAFKGVMEAVNNVVLNNQQISLNVQQQAIAIQQVVDAMNSINLAAKETSGGISQVKVGIKKLNDVAQNLNAVV